MIASSLKLCWRQQNLIHLYTQGPIRKKIWASFKYLFSRGSYSVNFNYMYSPKPILIMLLITRLTEKSRLDLTTYIKKKYPHSSKKVCSSSWRIFCWNRTLFKIFEKYGMSHITDYLICIDLNWFFRKLHIKFEFWTALSS